MFVFTEYIELSEILSKYLFGVVVVCPQTNESMLFDIGIINVQELKLRKKEKPEALRKIAFLFAE